MYRGVVYFAGPKTQWVGQIDESEILATYQARWLWLVRIATRSTHARLDPSRCGYALLCDGELIEHVETRRSDDPPWRVPDLPQA